MLQTEHFEKLTQSIIHIQEAEDYLLQGAAQ